MFTSFLVPLRKGHSGHWLLLIVGLVLFAGAVGIGAWYWFIRTEPKRLDTESAFRANNRGIGYIEQFKFAEAVEAFEEAHRIDPKWRVGRINLGIAYMNLAREEGATEGTKQERCQRAIDLFQSVLAEDPRDCHANYCMGFTYLNNLNEFDKAVPYFRKVVEVDSNDAATWYWLGRSNLNDENRADECYEKAYQLDPTTAAALDRRRDFLMRQGNVPGAEAVVKEMDDFKKGKWDWHNLLSDKYYSDHGQYAQVIGHSVESEDAPRTGPIPSFKSDNIVVELAPGARWAASADFGEGPVAELRKLVRQRFGAVMVVLDYDRDGLPDLFLLAAVVQDGKVRDLLLHNDGKGHFTDVTAKAGLAGNRPSLGCSVADFDNDGYLDLFITGAGEQHLFRNTGHSTFEDVTAVAGLDKLNGVCLGSAFVDIDQDGDLDLVVARFAATPENAVAALKDGTAPEGAGVVLFLNVGEAPAQVDVSKDPPPLTARFKQADRLSGVLKDAVPPVSFVVSDFDRDQDLDLLVLADGAPPTFAVNDRLLRLHKATLPGWLLPVGRWNGALVLDTKRRERSDLFFVGPDQPPVLLLSQPASGEPDAGKWFKPGKVSSPPLIQAVAIDLDLDGWTDIVGLSKEHKPVFLHNDGRQLISVPDAFGPDAGWKEDVAALVAGDFNDDGLPDVLVWSEGSAPRLLANQGNGNHSFQFYVTGHRHVELPGFSVRCSADGVGVWVVVQAEDLHTGLEYTTLSAGLGQSMQPITLGLGKHELPDVIRTRWPDMCLQADFSATAVIPGKNLFKIEESNRKTTSCPILFTWNGERFVFVTDFLGAGSIGELDSNGSTRPPRPEESVKIEADQLKPLKGKYVLKLAEPMDELTLLDRLQLVVMDHPENVCVFPDERFPGEGPPPTQDLLAFRREIFPVKAVDHRGKDVTKTLREWDRDTVRDFAFRSWLGFAEEHWVELDFGDRLKEFGAKDPLFLCMAGWTDYPYPESIYAAEQAGIALMPPVLERQGEDGKWQKVCEASFPAGLPRMMTVDVTGKLAGPSCKVRLRTNMQVFWDQIFVAPLVHRILYQSGAKEIKDMDLLHVTSLRVHSAELSPKACMLEYSPDGRQPTIYDYYRRGTNPVTVPAGRITRYGDVTELLNKADDCFVIFGPGDELTVNFDASKLPPLPEGWTRDFVLRTWGYCKDCAPFTATGDAVEPLPFRAMDTYPPHRTKYPDDVLHNDYRKRYNTRPVGKPRN
jgi:tetratricopeptide (TPR) repeat protein